MHINIKLLVLLPLGLIWLVNAEHCTDDAMCHSFHCHQNISGLHTYCNEMGFCACGIMCQNTSECSTNDIICRYGGLIENAVSVCNVTTTPRNNAIHGMCKCEYWCSSDDDCKSLPCFPSGYSSPKCRRDGHCHCVPT